MKIYTEVENGYFGSYVGVILLGDKDQTYMYKAFKTETNDEQQQRMFGIKRALSYVKANQPIYANDDITIYTPEKTNSLDEILQSDEYVQHCLKPNQKIEHNKQPLNDKDEYHLMCARTEIMLETRRDHLRFNTGKHR